MSTTQTRPSSFSRVSECDKPKTSASSAAISKWAKVAISLYWSIISLGMAARITSNSEGLSKLPPTRFQSIVTLSNGKGMCCLASKMTASPSSFLVIGGSLKLVKKVEKSGTEKAQALVFILASSRIARMISPISFAEKKTIPFLATLDASSWNDSFLISP